MKRKGKESMSEEDLTEDRIAEAVQEAKVRNRAIVSVEEKERYKAIMWMMKNQMKEKDHKNKLEKNLEKKRGKQSLLNKIRADPPLDLDAKVVRLDEDYKTLEEALKNHKVGDYN